MSWCGSHVATITRPDGDAVDAALAQLGDELRRRRLGERADSPWSRACRRSAPFSATIRSNSSGCGSSASSSSSSRPVTMTSLRPDSRSRRSAAQVRVVDPPWLASVPS